MGIGITGANLGVTANGSTLGTIFDSTAPRSIQDTSATAPFIGHYDPEGSVLTFPANTLLSALNGVWTLKITDMKSESGAGATPPVQHLIDWTVSLAGGFTTTEHTVGTTPIRGAVNAPYPLLTTASPTFGVGPDPVIAADNTLGSASSTKGNLYVAFVSRLPTQGTSNQTDNTDIVLFVSTNGGLSWLPGPTAVDGLPIVNNDYTDNDGFSEAAIEGGGVFLQGRPQFAPAIAVDQTTGAVVASWYDGRYDAARARVARFVGVSIDGGHTFTQTYLNTPGTVENPVTGATSSGTAYNVITGQVVSLQPIPDNFSAGNTTTDPTFSYGNQEGLAVSNGSIVATWTGNLNGGPSATPRVQRNEILVAQATFQAGPAALITDPAGDALATMGPITPSSATVLSSGAPVAFNSTTTADGTPVFDGFVVHFDRPIDASTFTLPTVSVFYRDANTSGLVAGVPVSVTNITPIFDSNSPLSQTQQAAFGPSAFLVSVAPQSGIGTYSYQIAPTIMDRIAHIDTNPADSTVGAVVSGNMMDENSDGTTGATPDDFFAIPKPVDPAASWNGAFFQPNYTSDTLPIIISGPHVVSSTPQGGQTTSSGTIVLNATASFIDVVFDRNMNPATFTPAQILSFIGPVGSIGPNGALPASFTITPDPDGTDPDPAHPRTFRINFLNPAGTAALPLTISGTYSLILSPTITDEEGNALDTNQNAGVSTLRETPVSGTAPLTYGTADVPKPIGSLTSSGVVTDSKIVVPDDFLVQATTVTINITYPRDPDLTVTLIAPNGTRITLVSGAGTGGTQANFVNTVFDDLASTPIDSGGPPFTGRFNPEEPLKDLLTGGLSSQGTWTLEIVTSQGGKTGTLNNWSLQLTEPLLSSGLGEAVGDRATVNFNIFTMDPTNPQSSSTWTSVGPTSDINDLTGLSDGGPIGAVAVDPSDPSGNTVYVGGGSGGVWKTTDFLTTLPQGPTYVPLTDFAPNLAMNVGAIAVFGRNNDPLQSEVFAGTGNPLATPEPTTLGDGFLRSQDGGQTWTLLDSSTNVDANGNILPLNSPQRDHIFAGLTINTVVVDPRPTPTGNVIVYAGVTDPAGVNDGVWRSLDSGNHWTKMIAGQATSIVLDPASGHVNVISNPTGNLQIVYAALQGQGVFTSPNEGQVWQQLLGQAGNPEVQDPNFTPIVPVPVTPPSSDPNTLPQGRVLLAKPALTGVFLPDGTYTGNAAEDVQYEGWLYAAVTSTTSTLSGIYITKNFGQSWTKITDPQVTGPFTDQFFIPSNNTSLTNADPTKTSTVEPGRANYDLTLAVNVNDPNIIYVGGLINLRLDITGLYDAGAFYLSNDDNDGGALRVSTTGPITLKNWPATQGAINPVTSDGQVINLFRDPSDVFNSNTVAFESNIGTVNNSGGGVTWTQFNAGTADLLDDGTDRLSSYLQVITTLDPTTGETRLIFGKSNGIFSTVDSGNTVDPGIGTADLPEVSRNGNLSLYQFFYSAIQPSAGNVSTLPESAADQAGALFYASGFKNGVLQSDANILTNGNQVWVAPLGVASAGGVATDQTDKLVDGSSGSTVYQFLEPYAGSGFSPLNLSPTEFFYTGTDGGAFTSHTFGLIQTSTGGGLVPDAEWPYMTGFNFAVNPIEGDQIVMVSNNGTVFSTSNRGTNWQIVGTAAALDGSVSQTQAFGAPQSSDPTGALNDFVYVGTNSGHIFVTFDGGGAAGNQWLNISTGLDGSEVKSIITDPTRNSLDAYAVTDKGVYFLADSLPSASNPTPTWVNITGQLFNLQHTLFGPFAAAGTPLTQSSLQSLVAGLGLTSIVADWRYAIPNNQAEINNPANPPGATHPVLYVAGSSGVYRSTDQGQTWTPFPDAATDGAPVDGGYLPNANVTDLDIALGDIDPTTGHPTINAQSPDILLATTFGRGDFAIRLAPTVVAGSLQLDPTLPAPTGSQSGTENGLPKVSILQPVFDGMSELSAFGNNVTVNLFDLTNPSNPVLIGVSPTNPSQNFVTTDQNGRFQIEVEPGYFKPDGSTDGIKTLGFQVVDGTGTIGPMSTFTFDLDTTPIVVASSVQFAAGSDSGRSATDRITNVIRPIIIGQVIQAAPETVQLIDVTNPNSPVVIGQGTTTASGSFSIQVNAGVYLSNGSTDGAKIISVVAIHLPNNSNSVLFNFTLDTTAPATPAAPSLLATSDSGFSNSDHITNVTTPTFAGTGEADAIVNLFANGSTTPVGTDEVNTTGTYTVTVGSALADGSYNMAVQLVDVAGNVSALSPIMQPPLMIETKAPTIPTIKLDPASDTGILGDNVTAAIPATFDGTTDASTSVIIKDNGVQIAAFLQPAGSTTFSQSLNLADGVHTLVVQATNIAGNVSNSTTLVVTINSQALDADSKFVRAIYEQALGRPGTIAEWNIWIPLLVNGNGRFMIANDIERATEARTLTLDNWYKTYFGRTSNPSTIEIQFWINEFNNGASEETVLSQLLASPEYFNRAPSIPGVTTTTPSDSAFVQGLFIQLLNRRASSSDINFFSNLVNSVGRQQVAFTLLTSAEYRSDQIITYYGQALLGRTVPPSSQEVSFWVNSGLDLTSIRIDFLATSEFFFRVTGLQP